MPGMGLAILFSSLFLSLLSLFSSVLSYYPPFLPLSRYFFLFQQRHQVCGKLTSVHQPDPLPSPARSCTSRSRPCFFSFILRAFGS